ncbi:hypothetical protein C8J57DRAFT_1720598 [Mycena rebaudengoi]|nr:hypothetical protein C8J57DRAFT_1720598 [Mycena rebaudengoi]
MHIIVLRKPAGAQSSFPPSAHSTQCSVRASSAPGPAPREAPPYAHTRPHQPQNVRKRRHPGNARHLPHRSALQRPAPTIPKKRRRWSCASADPALCPGW